MTARSLALALSVIIPVNVAFADGPPKVEKAKKSSKPKKDKKAGGRVINVGEVTVEGTDAKGDKANKADKTAK